MTITLAFDVYGTLVDTHNFIPKLEKIEIIGANAKEFAHTWLQKQLEYCFRRGLMQNYQNTAVCLRHALDYTCEYYKVSLSPKQKQELLDSFQTLPTFKDVKDGLTRLNAAADCHLYAFSSGPKDAIETLLKCAGIQDFFLGVVSTDDLKSFKPNPAVYSYFLRQAKASGGNAWLISSNPFDVIGAISAGMRAAWVQRSTDVIFDPWEIKPTITVRSIGELVGNIC